MQGEIDAQEDSFKATSQFGQSLISTGHYASEEVKEKVGSKVKVHSAGTNIQMKPHSHSLIPSLLTL